MAQAVVIQQDYDTGERVGWFLISLYVEPRLKTFQHQNFVLVSARDETGKTYAANPKENRYAHWQENRGSVVAFSNEYQVTKIKGISAAAQNLEELVLEIPVSLVTGVKECRFAHARTCAKPARQDLSKETSLSLVSAERGGEIPVKVEVQSKEAERGVWKVRAELDGIPDELWASPSRGSETERYEITLGTMSSSQQRLLKKDFDLVISYPSEATVAKPAFTFKDLRLGMPPHSRSN